MTAWILLIALAYIIGSIPFGVIIARCMGVDIREHGSKNIGATNVGRVIGKPFGLLCFALDFGKGAVPVFTAGWVTGVLAEPLMNVDTSALWMWMLVAVASVLGHMYSIFLLFTGGKGVATGFGAMVSMYSVLTFPALAALAVWIIVARVTRYVSLASMLAVAALPIGCVVRVALAGTTEHDSFIEKMMLAHPSIVVTLVLAVLVVFKHRTNIARLRAGTEGKIGEAQPSSDAAQS